MKPGEVEADLDIRAKSRIFMKKRAFQFLILLAGFLMIHACKSSSRVQSEKPPENLKKKTEQQQERGDNSRFFLDGVKQKSLGNTEQAINFFQKAIEVNPEEPAAHYELAKLLVKKNKLDEALYETQRAAELDPDNDWYKLLLANIYEKKGQYQESLEVWEELVQKNPDNIEYKFELAGKYIFAGEKKKAIELFDEIEERAGINEQLSIQKQKLYQSLGEEEKAIGEIQKLIQNNPAESRYYALLAEAYMNQGNREKALEAYKKISEIDPEDPYVHISLSDFYRKSGEQEKAFEELKLGFKNPQLDIDTKVQILLAYYTVNQLYSEYKDQALALSEILIEAHPEEPKAHSIHADLLYQQDKFEEAREAFRKVISIDSGKYVVWEQLLFIEAELEDYKAMKREASRAVELFPQQPLLYFFAGVSEAQLKNYEEAVRYLERGKTFVIENNPLLIQFYANLGDNYNQLGKHEKSDEYYEKALELDPNNSLVLNNYAYYLSLRGINLEKAKTMAEKAVQLDSANSANLDTYAWVLFKLGEFEAAEKQIIKAMEYGGEQDGTLHEHYGDILYKLGKKKEALQRWKKAKELGGYSELLEQKLKDRKYYE